MKRRTQVTKLVMLLSLIGTLSTGCAPLCRHLCGPREVTPNTVPEPKAECREWAERYAQYFTGEDAQQQLADYYAEHPGDAAQDVRAFRRCYLHLQTWSDELKERLANGDG